MKARLVFLILLFISFAACQEEKYVFSKYESTGGNWHKNDTLVFRFSPQDTTTSHHLFISLRNSMEYPFKNIHLISSIAFPNGKVVVDTLEYPMANNDGSFIGKGTSIIENKLWLKEQVQFNEEGEYVFKIRHAMRKSENVEGLELLRGVVDVGIQIEEIKD